MTLPKVDTAGGVENLALRFAVRLLGTTLPQSTASVKQFNESEFQKANLMITNPLKPTNSIWLQLQYYCHLQIFLLFFITEK